MPDDRLLVLIPTYNERENLPRIVPLVLEQHPGIEILVIDDGSPDGTGQLADEMAGGEPRVHVLHRTEKLGLGPAYLAGFKWGLARGYPLLCEMDADLSHAPEMLPAFIEQTRQADVVIGSRYLHGRVTVVDWPFRLVEVPIVFTERDSGESKMSAKIVREAVWRVWMLRILDLIGRL